MGAGNDHLGAGIPHSFLPIPLHIPNNSIRPAHLYLSCSSAQPAVLLTVAATLGCAVECSHLHPMRGRTTTANVRNRNCSPRQGMSTNDCRPIMEPKDGFNLSSDVLYFSEMNCQCSNSGGFACSDLGTPPFQPQMPTLDWTYEPLILGVILITTMNHYLLLTQFTLFIY